MYVLHCLKECYIVISVLIEKIGFNLVGRFTAVFVSNMQFL